MFEHISGVLGPLVLKKFAKNHFAADIERKIAIFSFLSTFSPIYQSYVTLSAWLEYCIILYNTIRQFD